MKHFALAFAALALVACNSCTPAPVPNPPPSPTPPPVPTVVVDAGPAPDGGVEPIIDPGVRSACVNMARVGCAEGGPMCAITMQKALVDGLTIVPLGCLTGATDKPAVRACGFVPCP